MNDRSGEGEIGHAVRPVVACAEIGLEFPWAAWVRGGRFKTRFGEGPARAEPLLAETTTRQEAHPPDFEVAACGFAAGCGFAVRVARATRDALGRHEHRTS